MSDAINGVKVPFIPIVTEESSYVNKIKQPGDSFSTIFKTELEKLKFSNHATQRLESRNIKLDEAEIEKLQKAVEKAELKGAKDSLVMMNNTAFIVNIPNKTVVTAMQVEQGGENVFTNIDSVVFAQ